MDELDSLGVDVNQSLDNINQPLKKEYLEKINSALPNGQTPLLLAIKRKYRKIACLLIQSKADVNVRGNDNCTPLTLASEKGDIEVMRLLIKFHADINAYEDEGPTSFSMTLLNNHIDACVLLIKKGATLGYRAMTPIQTPIPTAEAKLYFDIPPDTEPGLKTTQESSRETARYPMDISVLSFLDLINRGTENRLSEDDYNRLRQEIIKKNTRKLIKAIQNNDLPKVIRMEKLGVDLNNGGLSDTQEWTAFHYACGYGNL